MNTNVRHMIEKSEAKVVIFDIDGTLKDLCKEHDDALREVLTSNKVSSKRRKVILSVNKFAMFIVKAGILPTNLFMQRVLTRIYAILSGVEIKKFYYEYFNSYTKQICLFNGAKELLKQLSLNKKIFFATINKQNYNLEECGILQDRITYTTSIFKITAYRKLLKELNVEKHEVIIVGDNLFDDLLAAKFLSVKFILVNNYYTGIKKLIGKLVNSKYLK